MRLDFDNKRVRSAVIAEHLRVARRFEAGVVCLTCGNSAKALRAQGLQVVEIGTYGALKPNRWLKPAEVAAAFPTMFDATSGHLSLALMLEIGDACRDELGVLPTGVDIVVPSGSGETVICLSLAYPECHFVAEYCNIEPATVYETSAPLNPVVSRLCSVQFRT